jgi:hypothetical protein
MGSFHPRALLLLAILLVPDSARAEDENVFGLGVAAGSDLPLATLAELQLELPGRFYAAMGIGQIPMAFRKIANAYGREREMWSKSEGKLVEDNGQSSRILVGTFGYRPLRGRGLLVEARAAQVRLTVTGSPWDMLQIFADGARLPREPHARVETIEARLSVNLVGGQLGWEWRWGPAYARFTLGAMMPVRAQSELLLNWSDDLQTVFSQYDDERQREIEVRILRHLRLPTASLRIGAHLF